MPIFDDYQMYKSKTSNVQSNQKHIFFCLDQDVQEAEKRLQKTFPGELKSLFTELGYGFLCIQDKTRRDRIMDPHSIADYKLEEDPFIDSDLKQLYPDHMLVFFEIGDGNYLALDESQEDSNGACPVYYYDAKVADSLKEFLDEMDRETDYYRKF